MSRHWRRPRCRTRLRVSSSDDRVLRGCAGRATYKKYPRQDDPRHDGAPRNARVAQINLLHPGGGSSRSNLSSLHLKATTTDRQPSSRGHREKTGLLSPTHQHTSMNKTTSYVPPMTNEGFTARRPRLRQSREWPRGVWDPAKKGDMDRSATMDEGHINPVSGSKGDWGIGRSRWTR